MGMDKVYYQNNIEVCTKVHNGTAIHKNLPETELVETIKKG